MNVLSVDQKKQLKKLQKKIPTNKQIQTIVSKQLKVMQSNLPDKKQLKKLGQLAAEAGKVVLVTKTVNKTPLIVGAVIFLSGAVILTLWHNKRNRDLWLVDSTAEDAEPENIK